MFFVCKLYLVLLLTVSHGSALQSVRSPDTYESSSSIAKAVVSSLTAIVTQGQRSNKNSAVRARAKEQIGVDELLDGLREDISTREYLWTGDISSELYAEDCVFSDPTLKFEGLATFENNIASLEPILNRFAPAANRRVSLVDLFLDAENQRVEAKWRMIGDLALPWKPRLVLDGRTRFSYGQDGRIIKYDEAWTNLNAVQALAVLLKPSPQSKISRPQRRLDKNKRPSDIPYPDQVDHWPGRLDQNAAPPASPILSKKIQMIIMPGFGNDAIDYQEPLGQPKEVGLAACLERRGCSVSVVPIARADWLKVFTRGLTDATFLRGNADWTVSAYSWYLETARDTILEAKKVSNRSIVLCGHSAGGWLSRALFRRFPELESSISAVITLGAPHYPPRDRDCATRGVLASLRDADRRDGPPAVPFITVAGDAIDAVDPFTLDSYSRVAAKDAKFLCGDGVVPLAAAHLDFATQRITIDGALHSINQPGTSKPTDAWYGAERLIDDWLPSLEQTI